MGDYSRVRYFSSRSLVVAMNLALLLICSLMRLTHQQDNMFGGMPEGMDGMPEGMDMEAMMQMMGGGGGMPPMGGFKGNPDDIKYVICETCQALVEEAIEMTKVLRSKYVKMKVSELQVDEAVEHMCDTKHKEGGWISHYDMVETEDAISLEKHEQPGKCQDECKTLELACKKVQDEVNTDLVELLYLDKKSKSELQNVVCTKLIKHFKGACGKPYPKTSADRIVEGNNFVPMTDEDASMEEMNRMMRESQAKMEL